MNILYDIQNVVVLVLTAMDPLSSPRPAFDSIVMVKDMPASPFGGITKPLEYPTSLGFPTPTLENETNDILGSLGKFIVTSLAETSPIFVTLMSSNFCVPRTTFFVKDAGSKTNSGFRIDR
jgi:hypothetical protein